jgi:hypothetical protein
MDEGREKVYHLEFGYREVRLPGREEPLWLLVVWGVGQEPMMLLKTELLRRSRKVLWRLVRAYIRRWAIEETIRYIKQSYELEDTGIDLSEPSEYHAVGMCSGLLCCGIA